MADILFEPDPEAVCADCGGVGAWRFDGTQLCVDCYQARGACCAERNHEWTGEPPPLRCEREHGQ